MKKKNLLLMVVIIGGLFILSGCSKKEEVKSKEKQDTSVASTLTSQFKEEMSKNQDAFEVAKKISKNEIIATSVDVVELKDGDFVDGFDKEIKGYKKAYAIKPIIGSIPFIAYIFEVDNAKEFEKELNDNANLRWNVCTQADNKESAIMEDYVFFIMAPKTFEE